MQGSLLYTADLVQLLESFELYSHLYADDTHIYGFCRPWGPTVYGNVLLTVSLPLLIGCIPIDFSWMHTRWRYCGALHPVDKVSYLLIRWLLALISCRLSDVCEILVFSLMLTWRCVPKSRGHVRSVLLPFDNCKAYVCVKWHDPVAHRGDGVFQAWLRLRNSCRPSEATHGQVSVCAERRCMADLQSLLSGPHSAVTVQITLASDAKMCFLPAGSSSVSLPPRLCTWLPGLRSSACVTPQCTSTTALFDYISAGRSMYWAFYHWRPHLPSDCCIGLEQSAGVCSVIAVVASFPQQTENRTLCLVLQMTKNVFLHWLLLLFRLIITCPCSLRT